MNVDEAFAEVLRNLRRKAKLTQQEVADHIGMTRQCFWQIETQAVSVKLGTFYKIAGLFELKPEELVQRVSLAYKERRD